MNAAKTSAPRRGFVDSLLRAAAWPMRGTGTVLAAFLILLVVFIGALGYAWRRWGGLVANHPRYAISAEHLEITPQPAWIRANVKDEVIRDGSFASLSLLDPQVTIKVARAFGVHTWVSDVKRVRKQYPSQLIVDIEYRRPVAMVEVVTRGERGLLPVDGKGVLLPPQDFTPEQSREFLRVSAGDTLPAGPAGTPWGDERVVGASQVAAALLEHWKQLDLHRVIAITPPDATRRRPIETTFELTTRGGTRILWGHAPGKEISTEASTVEKIARLNRLAEQQGKLPGESSGLEIDLREKSGLTMNPRTAQRQP